MALANTRVILAAIIVILVIAAGFYILFSRQQAANVIVIGTTDDVTELDPATSYDFFTWEVLSNVMAGLVTYDQQGNIVPYLAERWESQEGGKVWIFYLRQDAKFPDGTPCDADVVVRSIKRVMTIQGDPSWLVTEFVENVEALDQWTVKFTLKQPTGYFLAVVATPPYYPVHPNYPEDQPAPDATWGGCGPYMIDEFVRDQYLRLKPNPNFFGEEPRNDGVIIRFYEGSEDLRSALEAGEIDVAWRTLNPSDLEDLRSKGYNVKEVPGLFIRYLVLRVSQPPLDNVAVRQALAAAIDRQDIVDRVFRGTMEPLYSMVPSGMWGHYPAFKEKYGEGPNIDLARQLLSQAGYSESNKLQVELWYTPEHYGDTEAALAAVIKEQWEATGMISVEIKSSEWGTYVDQLSSGQMMISLLGWYPDYLDPDNFLTPFLLSTANSWTGTGYANPQVDELLRRAMTSSDMNERAQLYKQVQEILAEEVPFIPLVQGKLFVVTSTEVTSIEVSPLQFLIYSSISK
ncbi:dipeptide ABC transporter, dipeptide-binding protein DppA [Aeropyrum pernix]|uniref:Dipeptide ABC transporter, dipeptide-binding protein DppA n=1 Tax=Aeropyrum pernix TaxID=56636 RepID=A0A401H775_AERPX|nr:ABC transporter substrate-binding protein [Aeropyrum pernix]GBF08297.1 dipeptide ABC transporter, dipeptide-binding protein DppA [Aeropyrum pernix]